MMHHADSGGPLPASRSVFRDRIYAEEQLVSHLKIERVSRLSDDEIEALSRILIGVVDAGASVGFVPPLSLDDADAYWRGVLKPGCVLLTASRSRQIVGTGQLELAMRANGRT